MVKEYRIPTRRKVLTEKYIKDDIKKEDNKFILDFLSDKGSIIETFFVFCNTVPKLRSENTIYPGIYTFDKRVSWEPLDFFIYENIGKGSGKRFLNWINTKKHRTRNFILSPCLSNQTKGDETWKLYGCLAKSTFDFFHVDGEKKHGLGISLKANYCTIEFQK